MSCLSWLSWCVFPDSCASILTKQAPRGIPPAGRFALTAALLSSFGQTFFLGLFGGQMRADFGLTEAWLGSLYGLATLASGLLMFWLGSMADHLSMKRAIGIAMLLLAAGAALMGLAGQVWLLFVALFLVRLAGQGLTGHLAVVAAARYAHKRRGRAVAMATYGFILGEASFPMLVAFSLGWLDWQQLWLLVAVLIALVAIPVLWWLASSLHPVSEPVEPVNPQMPAMTRMRLFRHAGFMRVLAIVLVPPVMVTALFLHQGTLAEIRDWRLDQMARGFVAFAAAQALFAFAGGRLIDRFSARALLRFHLLPLGFALLALASAPDPFGLWLFFAGLGMTAGVNGVICGAVWVELFGTAKLGMIRGVYAALMVVSTAVGPVVLGLVFDWQVSLLAVAVVCLAYVLILPPLLVPGIHGFEPRQNGEKAPAD